MPYVCVSGTTWMENLGGRERDLDGIEVSPTLRGIVEQNFGAIIIFFS